MEKEVTIDLLLLSVFIRQCSTGDSMKYLLSGYEMKNWEKQAMENYKTPSLLLMERAAMAVTEELLGGGYDLHKVLIACGTGNNGGDGFAIARMLKTKGYSVEVCVAGSLERLTPDAKQQLEMYQAISGKFVTDPVYEEYTVIVDALFGIGCNREITGIAAQVIDGMNQSGVQVVSVDVPSGISADTGKVCGCAVRAASTVTFFTEKLGMMLYPGYDHCGKIVVADMGIPVEASEQCSAVAYGEKDLEKLPKRKNNSHKGTYGKVLVIAGSPNISGAAYFAACAAYRMGSGLVKILTAQENKQAMQVLLPEALLEAYDKGRLSNKQINQCLEWADVIVIGPGLGTDKTAEKLVKYVLGKARVPLVVDADGINILAKDKACLLDAQAPLVLTPHIQEMARLLGCDREELLKNPMGTAKKFAENYPVVLVLKDARTIVIKNKETPYINVSGNHGMATGGSGDVLAGIIGSLAGQGMSPFEAAKLGVYLHGKAGDMAAKAKGMYGMTASDLLDGIFEVTKV